GRMVGAITENDSGRLFRLGAAGVAFIAVLALLGVLQSYLSNLAAQSVMYDLRDRLYRHLTGMSLSWFTASRTGEVLSRISSDVQAVQSVISDTLGSIVGNSITVATSLAVMFALDWRLAVISIVVVPIFVIPARRVGEVQRVLWGESQAQTAAMTSQM